MAGKNGFRASAMNSPLQLEDLKAALPSRSRGPGWWGTSENLAIGNDKESRSRPAPGLVPLRPRRGVVRDVVPPP